MCGYVITDSGKVKVNSGEAIQVVDIEGNTSVHIISPYRFVREETFDKKFPKGHPERAKRLYALNVKGFVEQDSNGKEHIFHVSSPLIVAKMNHRGEENVGILTTSSKGSPVERVHHRRPKTWHTSDIPNLNLTGI